MFHQLSNNGQSELQKSGERFLSNKVNIAAMIIILVGIVLRLVQYYINRSLWLDESSLALNILNRSYPELLKPLNFYQSAPVGFLFIEKLNEQLLGSNEFALRLFPLIAGVASLLLFYVLARQVLRKESVLIALALFTLSGPLIYYSSEVKQYSSDVAFTLALLIAAFHFYSHKPNPLSILLFGLMGAAAIWFSNPSIFVLCGIGTVLTAIYLLRKDWTALGRSAVIFSLWSISILAYYVAIISQQRNSGLVDFMKKCWKNSFMPLIPSSISDFQWYSASFFSMFSEPGGFVLIGVAAMAFLTGCICMFRRSRNIFLILLSPVAITLLVSGFKMYPFTGRFLLFLTPILLLLIAEGAEHVMHRTGIETPAIGSILIGLLFFHPLVHAAQNLITLSPYETRTNEDIKTVLKYVKDHKKTGDTVYSSFFARNPFEFYAKSYGFDEEGYIKGNWLRNDKSNAKKEINRVRDKDRVWFLFTHTTTATGKYEEDSFLYELDSFATKLDYFKSEGASLYLYDLGER